MLLRPVILVGIPPARGAGEFGVGFDGGGGVAGHFDFGDDVDVVGAGVGDDFADVVLSVVAAEFIGGLSGGGLGGGLLHGAAAFDEGVWGEEGGVLGELGVFFDFDAPAFVIGEVPVEGVHFVVGEEVDIAEDFGLGEEVAGAVEVHAAPGEAGGVFDVAAGEFDVGGMRELVAAEDDGIGEVVGIGGDVVGFGFRGRRWRMVWTA